MRTTFFASPPIPQVCDSLMERVSGCLSYRLSRLELVGAGTFRPGSPVTASRTAGRTLHACLLQAGRRSGSRKVPDRVFTRGDLTLICLSRPLGWHHSSAPPGSWLGLARPSVSRGLVVRFVCVPCVLCVSRMDLNLNMNLTCLDLPTTPRHGGAPHAAKPPGRIRRIAPGVRRDLDER